MYLVLSVFMGDQRFVILPCRLFLAGQPKESGTVSQEEEEQEDKVKGDGMAAGTADASLSDRTLLAFFAFSLTPTC